MKDGYYWVKEHMAIDGVEDYSSDWQPALIEDDEIYVTGHDVSGKLDVTFPNAAGSITHSWYEIGPRIVHTTIDLHELLAQIHKDYVDWGTLQVPSRTHLTQILAEIAEGSK